MGDKADYGNWVPKKLIYIPGAIALFFLALAALFPLSLIGAVLFLIPAAYFAYARHLFSSGGGDFQSRVRDMVSARLDWNGQGTALDIGCGNGPLAIEIARKFPNARVFGIDYWGKGWEYSKQACQRNAELERVADRMTFQKASASQLPFQDEFFDAAVSNLAFHEVSDTRDKREVLREALRVVKKGGVFSFQDLFLWKGRYPEIDVTLETIRSWGVERVEFARTGDSDFIPWALKLPFMIGTIGVIYGRK